jgi:hypothetical protein
MPVKLGLRMIKVQIKFENEMKLSIYVEELLVYGFTPLPSILNATIFRNLVLILGVTQSTYPV